VIPRPLQAIWVAALLVAGSSARAEDAGPAWRLGLGASYGTQRTFPYGNRNYLHDDTGYKLLANRTLWAAGTWSLELQLEPSVYVVRHRLLNLYFVGPSHGPDYLAQRARFLRGESYEEYALNLGLVGRYRLTQVMSLFVLASAGPMWSEAATERLARGFAFSDIVAVGVGYRIRGALLEVRPGLRHESNADLQLPNSGHNTTTLDLAVSFGR